MLASKRIRLREVIYKQWDLFTILLLVGGLGLFMLKYLGDKSFWYDEMLELFFIREENSFQDMLGHYIRMEDVAPPLFSILAYIWYRIVPHTDKWLRLLPTLLVLGGIFVTSLTGRKALGKSMGVWTALFAVTSSTVVIHGGYEFRQYGLLFFISAISLYFYTVRLKAAKQEKWWMIFAYAFSLLLTVGTHYFAVFFCFALFVVDLVLVILKKISKKCIWSYFFGGGIFLPWGLMILIKKGGLIGNFWPDVPKWTSIVSAFQWLLGDDEMVYTLYLVGIGLILGLAYYMLKKKTYSEEIAFGLAWVWIPFCMVGCNYFYSTRLFPGGSVFVRRYFFPCLPCMFLVMAYLTEKVLQFIKRHYQEQGKTVMQVLIFVVVLGTIGTTSGIKIANDAKKSKEPYRENAEWIARQDDITEEQVAVVSTEYDPTMIMWKEHYVSDYTGKQFDVLSIMNQTDQEMLKSNDYKKIYFVKFHNNWNENAQMLKWIKQNYRLEKQAQKGNVRIYVEK